MGRDGKEEEWEGKEEVPQSRLQGELGRGVTWTPPSKAFRGEPRTEHKAPTARVQAGKTEEAHGVPAPQGEYQSLRRAPEGPGKLRLRPGGPAWGAEG